MKAVRGKIRNKEHAQTLRDYSGMAWGRITPTDIDGFVEFGDRVFILIESKYGSAPLSVGQRLALERLADAVGRTRHCLLVVCSHNSSRDDYTCTYCGERGGSLECDHVIPVSRGGGHADSNLTTSCRKCNRSKRDRPISEWSPC